MERFIIIKIEMPRNPRKSKKEAEEPQTCPVCMDRVINVPIS